MCPENLPLPQITQPFLTEAVQSLFHVSPLSVTRVNPSPSLLVSPSSNGYANYGNHMNAYLQPECLHRSSVFTSSSVRTRVSLVLSTRFRLQNRQVYCSTWIAKTSLQKTLYEARISEKSKGVQFNWHAMEAMKMIPFRILQAVLSSEVGCGASKLPTDGDFVVLFHSH